MKEKKYIIEYKELMAEWDFDANNQLYLDPNKITHGSHKKAHWICKTNQTHKWQAEVKSRVSGNGCKFCAGQAVSDKNSLYVNYPELMKEWNYTLNEANGINPNDFSYGSRKEVYWTCLKCNETYPCRISNKVLLNRGCPFCSNKKVNNKNNLSVRFPSLANEWDNKKNDKKATEVLPHTNKVYFWVCANGHSYKASPNNRTTGDACPYCSGNQVCDDNCLETLNPQLSKEWHPTKNIDLTPRDVTANSNKSVWWLCECGFSYKAKVNNRANGKGCRQCAKRIQSSFPEQAIFFYIKQIFPDAINGYIVEGNYELDIYIPSCQIGIEYDGYNWHSSEKSSEKDSKKNVFVNEKGIKLIRIREKGCAQLLNNDCIIINCVAETRNFHINEVVLDLIANIKKIVELEIEVKPNIQTDRFQIIAQYKTTLKEKSIAFTHPSLIEEWDSEKNKPLKPEMFSYGSDIEVSWICKNDTSHKWNARINTRTKGTNCPICYKERRKKAHNNAYKT
ncbi:hypothetical protein BZG01_16635 [Labilibaculum manganireducens]|uniref:Treble clef zinc finger domain-containing protein n=1 Tax=Labilibaculum manganireducens TaxID=1940525 RepID=A0A2N3HXX0_9BACT|nr:zinc-ribbon domain-containing protein [Labilibaculum manganireducens]PKQ62910.1 hypothetical protein BZG01_16635 [Labilibaculum manganireducens]